MKQSMDQALQGSQGFVNGFTHHFAMRKPLWPSVNDTMSPNNTQPDFGFMVAQAALDEILPKMRTAFTYTNLDYSKDSMSYAHDVHQSFHQRSFQVLCHLPGDAVERPTTTMLRIEMELHTAIGNWCRQDQQQQLAIDCVVHDMYGASISCQFWIVTGATTGATYHGSCQWITSDAARLICGNAEQTGKVSEIDGCDAMDESF